MQYENVTAEENTVTEKMKIAAVVAVLAVTVVVPAAVALAHSDGDVGADRICVELDELGLPPFGGFGRGGPFGFLEEFGGGGPFGGELWGELEGLLEGFPIEELIAGLLEGFGGFGGEGPFGFLEEFEGESPLAESPPWGGHGPFDLDLEQGMACLPTPAARAETLQSRAAELLEAMRDAGLDVGTETIEVEVPVWDGEDPAVKQFLIDYLLGSLVTGSNDSGEGRVEFPLDLDDLMDREGAGG